jgi:hypothetical protein
MIFLDARRRADGQCEGYESLLGGNCLRPKEGGYGNELHLATYKGPWERLNGYTDRTFRGFGFIRMLMQSKR